MKLEINYGKKNGKNTNMWRLNNMLIKNQWVNQELKEKIRKYLETSGKKPDNDPKYTGCSKSSSKREVYSNTILPQEPRKISNKQPNLLPSELEKEQSSK